MIIVGYKCISHKEYYNNKKNLFYYFYKTKNSFSIEMLSGMDVLITS